MGQLSAGDAIFLSASVPDPSAKHFVGEGDSVAISSAIASLLHVTLGRRRLVWGGHPAITPMVWAFADSMGINYGEWVVLYQSLFFKDEFPEETRRFKNVVFTKRVDGDLAASLAIMRERMIAETAFAAAVFIGGMRGVIDECRQFSQRVPSATILPIMSTGGAALKLGQELDATRDLVDNLDYVELFYGRLGIDPNERRYAAVAEQPADFESRLATPGHGRPRIT